MFGVWCAGMGGSPMPVPLFAHPMKMEVIPVPSHQEFVPLILSQGDIGTWAPWPQLEMARSILQCCQDSSLGPLVALNLPESSAPKGSSKEWSFTAALLSVRFGALTALGVHQRPLHSFAISYGSMEFGTFKMWPWAFDVMPETLKF